MSNYEKIDKMAYTLFLIYGGLVFLGLFMNMFFKATGQISYYEFWVLLFLIIQAMILLSILTTVHYYVKSRRYF